MYDAALRPAEYLSEVSVGTVVHDVVPAIAIQHEEIPARQMKRPRRTVLIFLHIFPARLGPSPLLQHLALQGDQPLRSLDQIAGGVRVNVGSEVATGMYQAMGTTAKYGLNDDIWNAAVQSGDVVAKCVCGWGGD